MATFDSAGKFGLVKLDSIDLKCWRADVYPWGDIDLVNGQEIII